jgi:hypothetical protein
MMPSPITKYYLGGSSPLLAQNFKVVNIKKPPPKRGQVAGGRRLEVILEIIVVVPVVKFDNKFCNIFK